MQRARLVREREYASEVFFEGVGYAASEARPRERDMRARYFSRERRFSCQFSLVKCL